MATIRSLGFVGTVVTTILVSTFWTAIRRLYLSPLAPLPGPKLAALTWWYECFYDVVRPGRYAFKIQELHKQNGNKGFPYTRGETLPSLTLRPYGT